MQRQGRHPWECDVRRIAAGRHLYKAQAVPAQRRGGQFRSSSRSTQRRARRNVPPTVAILTPAEQRVDHAGHADRPDGGRARRRRQRRRASNTGVVRRCWARRRPAPWKWTLATPALENASIIAKAFDNHRCGDGFGGARLRRHPCAPQRRHAGRRRAPAAAGDVRAGGSRRDARPALGVNGWLDEQFAMPLTFSHLQYLRDVAVMPKMEAQEQTPTRRSGRTTCSARTSCARASPSRSPRSS